MKHLFAIIIITLNSALGFGQAAEFNFISNTTVKWDKTPEGEVLKHYFVYENTGDVPLTIEEANVTCSCTKVTYPKQPTAPEERDSILVSFDTNNKFYYQNRTIELIANTKRKEKLKLKVYVIPKEED